MNTIKEVSRITGVSPRTLHYYDSIGLLKPARVTESGYRLYDEASLERLQHILLFKELRFPLKKIKDVYKRQLKGPVLGITVALMHERRRHHLHQHRFTASVSQGQKRTLSIQMKGFITDFYGIIIIVQINQPDCIYLTHSTSPNTFFTL